MDGTNLLSAKHLLSRRLTPPLALPARHARCRKFGGRAVRGSYMCWCPLRGRFNRLKPPVRFRKLRPDVLLPGKVPLRGLLLKVGDASCLNSIVRLWPLAHVRPSPSAELV